jgi:hypothetical protein
VCVADASRAEALEKRLTCESVSREATRHPEAFLLHWFWFVVFYFSLRELQSRHWASVSQSQFTMRGMPNLIVFLLMPLHSLDEFTPFPKDSLTAQAEDAETLQQAQTLKDAVRKYLRKECGIGELKKLFK